MAIVVCVAAPGAAAAQERRVAAGAATTPAATFSPDRVIVEWAPGASAGARRAARARADVDPVDGLGHRRFELVATEPGQAPGAAVRELRADPAVVRVQRDGYDVPSTIPDDPLFGELWGLRNAGLGVDGFAGAVAGADIDATRAWERTVGSPTTVVAVIDSGYRFEHPDLAAVAWTNPDETRDGVDEDGNGIVDDVHGADFVGPDATDPVPDGDPTDDDLRSGGHGVHVAGTIGARGNDGIGITGVAQDVRIMPLRACSDVDGDTGCPHSAIVRAINYAGAKRARVANLSLGGSTRNAALAGAIAANPQTLFVISAGNDGADNDARPHYPCVYDPVAERIGPVDNVVCVAATDQADRLARFSNWGAGTVDLGAPGTQTLSAYPLAQPLRDDFERDDFHLRWRDSGADGGFGRTAEPPLRTFGIADSPGAAPLAGAVRASTSEPLALPSGYRSCDLELTRSVAVGAGGSFLAEVLLDGEIVLGVGSRASGHVSFPLIDRLAGGGEVALRVVFDAGPDPRPGDGVWIEDVAITCLAQVGEAAGYAYLQGTSMAAPHVSGAAALLFSFRPAATVTDVREGLLGSVDRLPSLAGKTTAGGRLDAAAALDLLAAGPRPRPEPRPGDGGGGGATVAPALDGSGPPAPPPAVGGPGDPALPPAVGEQGGPAPAPAPSAAGGLRPPPAARRTRARPPRSRGCRVPALSGLRLARAKARLRTVGCRLGRVRRPRARRGTRRVRLVVRATRPAAGARSARGRVDVTLRAARPRGPLSAGSGDRPVR